MFNPLLFGLFLCVFLCFYFFLRSFTISGMVAVGSYPIMMMFYPYPIQAIVYSICISGMVLFAHRQNIKGYFQKKDK